MILTRKNKKRKLFIVFFLSLIASIVVVISVFTSGIFNIKTLGINLNQIDCTTESEIRNQANILRQNFFFVSQDFVNQALKEKFYCIREVNLSKFFPNKAHLTISGREAAATLIQLDTKEELSIEHLSTPSAQNTQNEYLVDNEGFILSRVSDRIFFPKIYLGKEFTEITIGKKLDVIDIGLTILEKLKNFELDIENVQIIDQSFVIFSKTGPRIVFKLDDSIDTQTASLQLILAKAKIDLAELSFIDLRFDKPVVRLAPK